MGGLGPTELIIILVVVLLLFGSTKLPKLARSIGEASQEFKKGVNEGNKAEPEPVVKPEPVAKADESVTMTKAQLDALLAEREAQARKDSPPLP
ncbi:MAG: twin-arginine translocase TatA/TatE family subunit [Acidimicrobiales bacterium]